MNFDVAKSNCFDIKVVLEKVLNGFLNFFKGYIMENASH
ncbi:hypothetical protein PRO82_001468 [Candidatus Protochlamydia amoebophila]|nr:hypothetical protein [Candidatus Protochlamydia amoebophila]